VLRAVEACGGRVHVRGVDRIRDLPGPAVYVANHMSMIETLLLPVLMLKYRLVTMVIKESLLRYPVFGTVMRACRPIAVGRRDPREDLRKVMEEGERILRTEGRSIIVFPQATRSPLFSPADFNSLGVKLARAAGVPVVPLALKTDFHGIGRRLRDFGPVDRSKPLHFEFGAPLAVSGTGREQHAACVTFISERLRAWGGTVQTEQPMEPHAPT
jgi:1-acyl-sn-glycerol-3-phosphate acyltransferase